MGLKKFSFSWWCISPHRNRISSVRYPAEPNFKQLMLICVVFSVILIRVRIKGTLPVWLQMLATKIFEICIKIKVWFAKYVSFQNICTKVKQIVCFFFSHLCKQKLPFSRREIINNNVRQIDGGQCYLFWRLIIWSTAYGWQVITQKGYLWLISWKF